MEEVKQKGKKKRSRKRKKEGGGKGEEKEDTLSVTSKTVKVKKGEEVHRR